MKDTLIVFLICTLNYSSAISQLQNGSMTHKPSPIAIVHVGNKSGVVNLEGKEIIAPIYKKIHLASDGLFSVERYEADGTTKWGFYDFNGTSAIPFIYDETSFFVNGLAPVRLGKKWGYINKKGELVIDLIYEKAEYFGSGRGKVTLEGKIGYIDTLGKFVIEPKFTFAHRFYDGFAWVNGGKDKLTLIDVDGNPIVDTSYHVELKFSDYQITKISTFQSATPENKKFGYINNKGKIIIPAIYDDGGYFFGAEITYVVKIIDNKRKFGFITSSNEMITGFDFDYAEPFHKSHGIVAIGTENVKTTSIEFEGKEFELEEGFRSYGAVDINGKIVIPLEYEKLKIARLYPEEFQFSTEAVFIASKKGRTGVINSNGEIIIPFNFDEIIYQMEGIFSGRINDEYYLINTENKVLFHSKEIGMFWPVNIAQGLFRAREKQSYKLGVINLDGQWIIEPKYDSINSFHDVDFKI